MSTFSYQSVSMSVSVHQSVKMFCVRQSRSCHVRFSTIWVVFYISAYLWLRRWYAPFNFNLPRLRCTDSYRKIGYHFAVSKQTATRVKWRVQGYMLYKNPLGSLPSHVTSFGLTEDQVWYQLKSSGTGCTVQLHTKLFSSKLFLNLSSLTIFATPVSCDLHEPLFLSLNQNQSWVNKR